MIIELTEKIYKSLTPSEKVVINYINENKDKISKMSIVDIAEYTYTSIATVSRSIKKCGLDGFSELRYNILKNTNGKQEHKDINNILEKSLLEVKNTIEKISVKDILDAIKIIKNSKKIYILARGLTEHVASELGLKLNLLGYNSFPIYDPKIINIVSQDLKNDECILILSLRGLTKELVTASINAKQRNCKVITCCCSEDTPLKNTSDIMLTGMKHKNISIKKYEVTSRIPLQVISRAIIDYLILSDMT